MNEEGLWSAMISLLNKSFWIVSIGVWLWIVARSGIFSGDASSGPFWPNFLIFVAAGAGVIATKHFLASALPLSLGVMVVVGTAHDAKGNWALLNIYIVAAIAIGFFATMARLSRLNNEAENRGAD